MLPEAQASAGYLYVAEYHDNVVAILKNGTWNHVGSISNGIVGPQGSWVDASGNLYVVNLSGQNIVEYKNGAKSPTFTYDARMYNPINVTTDAEGNVYEADSDGFFLNEYPQMKNALIARCSVRHTHNPVAVAVDKQGDVFVLFIGRSGYVAEYKGGLRGCSKVKLGVALDYPTGMVLDSRNNLIIADDGADSIDIVKPPYAKISGTVGTGYYGPFDVKINKKNDRIYVTEQETDVKVVSYPGGTLLATLDSANGLGEPISAVDADNFVP